MCIFSKIFGMLLEHTFIFLVQKFRFFQFYFLFFQFVLLKQEHMSSRAEKLHAKQLYNLIARSDGASD
jgi:hypothetical protein